MRANIERPFWTLSETIAWVMFRTPEAVADAKDVSDIRHVIDVEDAKRLGVFLYFGGRDRAWKAVAERIMEGKVRAIGRPGPDYQSAQETQELTLVARDLSLEYDPLGFEGLFLKSPAGRNWYEVALARSEVMREFPSSEQTDDVETGAESYRTGAPGRPSSMHLVEAEAQRRLNRGDFPDSLADFSRDLEQWYCATHPEKPRMTNKTIRNRLRHIFNKAKAARN